MRKGLVVTLGVVALVCVVTPGFALAPIITCVPDIIVSDVEQNSQTDDLNFFIFSDALDLDDLVVDADDPSSTIRWSFIETTPGSNTLTINGIESDPAVNTLEPGASDLRMVSRYATFENIALVPTPGSDYATDSMITLYASDGTAADSADIIVTTMDDSTAPYDDLTPGDSTVIPQGQTYTWTTSSGDWDFYGFAGLDEPLYSVNNALVLEQTDAMDGPLVYGAWESSKDPANTVQSKLGCVLRARYDLTSPDGAVCPSFRMRANWMKVVWNATYGIWVIDLSDQDFNAEQFNVYQTFDANHIPGREPGTSGQMYTLLYYPEQTDTVASTGSTYLAFEMVEGDNWGSDDDFGILTCRSVEVDYFDNPGLRTGRIDYDPTDYSNWVNGVTPIGLGTPVGVNVVSGANGISISMTSSSNYFEAVSHSPDLNLEPGRYYRATYMVTSTQQPGGSFGPTVRGMIASSTFTYSNQKDMKGGGQLSAFDMTPRPYHLWLQAPSADTGSNLTEAMWVIFESYLTDNPSPFFPGKSIEGTVTCSDVVLESWPEMP